MTGGNVRPKKHLGQHFLTDQNIARKIVDSLELVKTQNVLEVGPGKGILTGLLAEKPDIRLKCIEIDYDAVDFLREEFKGKNAGIVSGDFLKIPMNELFDGEMAVIGNFPYNISSQILFRVLENKTSVPIMVGMFQKEVADRIVSPPGPKDYGILSVLVQSYYNAEKLFQVSEQVFYPLPKVKSVVIRLIRKESDTWPKVDPVFYSGIIRTAFGQRRKMLRNSLASYNICSIKELTGMTDKRPEQLSVQDFFNLATILFNNRK